MRRHHISFKYAWEGIVYVFKTQPNFRIHTLAASLVLFASLAFGISRIELVILLFTIMLVIIAEMLNTAIEAVTDLLTTEKNKYAKVSKDVAAGMVLLSAFLAIVVGVIIFTPYLSTTLDRLI